MSTNLKHVRRPKDEWDACCSTSLPPQQWCDECLDHRLSDELSWTRKHLNELAPKLLRLKAWSWNPKWSTAGRFVEAQQLNRLLIMVIDWVTMITHDQPEQRR